MPSWGQVGTHHGGLVWQKTANRTILRWYDRHSIMVQFLLLFVLLEFDQYHFFRPISIFS